MLYTKYVKYKINTANTKKNSTGRKNLRIAGIILLVLVFIGALLFALEKTNVTNFYSKKTAGNTADVTTSSVPSAQADFSDGDERAEGNTLNENEGSASVDDLNGNSGATTDKNTWLTSKTGEIVVHSPTTNQTIKSGVTLSGTSSLSSVNYRVIDSLSGVIASGRLNVVNGKFAATISFTTSAPEGRLDIFGTRADESEFSNVEVPVRFN